MVKGSFIVYTWCDQIMSSVFLLRVTSVLPVKDNKLQVLKLCFLSGSNFFPANSRETYVAKS